jgi:hypothetical protein
LASRRYSIRVQGRRFFFHYRPDTHTYRLTVDDVPHQGPADTLATARDLVREIVRAALEEQPS